MSKYNFDTVIERRGTGAVKYESLAELFGRTDVTPMWIADMEFAVCPDIVKAMRERIDHPVYGYSVAPDSYWTSICDWLERRHGFRPEREHLAFVPGVVRGIAYALNFFTRPGDKVVIQPPVYHPFRAVTEGNDRVVVENPLRHTDTGIHYEMDLEHLEHVFATEHPRMMILCNPHNPVGIQWDADTLRTVASLAKKYGVIVLSDEIHGDLMLWGRPHIPFACVSPEAAEVSVSFGAPSKTFNIAGLVSSWMIVRNPALREPFYRWMTANEFSSPFFSATIATEVAYRCGEQWLDEMLRYLEGNVEAVERYVRDNIEGVSVIRPQASFLIWLDCRSLGLSQPELVDMFVNQAHLALNDGAMFGRQGQGYMRLNIGMPRRQLLEAMAQLKEAVAELASVQC
ncbi:MAG: pyridoxal phosphate-dependent aminotransferase [Muribaculaceae bacterium]|nr:pyridoxal phosphate-dependent aminotransferase [Muribaculaceae bacterium]